MLIQNPFTKKFSSLNSFNNFSDAVVAVNDTKNIIYWNKKASQLFGFDKKEMIGRNIAIIIDWEAEKIDEALKTGNTVILSSKNHSGMEIFVEISLTDLNNKLLIIARDVTKNQRILEKLLVEYEKFHRIGLNKNNFILGLSSDFKTPIHSLIGFSQGLLDGICGELNEKQDKYVSIMNKNANNLLELTDDFIELSRLEKEDLITDMRIFNLTVVVNEICEKLRKKTEKKGLTFDVDLNDLVKKNVYSNEELFSKILSNILHNAVKFTEIGSIRLKVLHPDIDFVRAHGFDIPDDYTDKSYLLFNITDTGIGISREDIPVIFDEYSQTDRNIAKKHGGTGLKLALTKKMLNRIGGSIWVESEVGQGSTFSFIIPIERPQMPEKTEEPEPETVEPEVKAED